MGTENENELLLLRSRVLKLEKKMDMILSIPGMSEKIQEITPPKEKSMVFKKPTIEEIAEFCKQRNNGIDAERFFAYYEARGWKIGAYTMKNWQMAVITWEKRSYASAPQQSNFPQKENKPQAKPWWQKGNTPQEG